MQYSIKEVLLLEIRNIMMKILTNKGMRKMMRMLEISRTIDSFKLAIKNKKQISIINLLNFTKINNKYILLLSNRKNMKMNPFDLYCFQFYIIILCVIFLYSIYICID